jgi:transposase
VDIAGRRKARAWKIPENIRLITQPSHGPELNPAEHLWDKLREKCVHDKAFRTLDYVQEALRDGLCDLMKAPERLPHLADFPSLRGMM